MTTADEGRGKPFQVGKEYPTQGGALVTVTEEMRRGTDHACVCGSDGIWRYNRPDDRGRVTGSAFDMSDPLNLIPEKANQ